MSYVWRYISAYTDARGNTVPASADNVAPAGWVYVDTVGGNDTTGNGSRTTPYKTINKGCTIVGAGTVCLASSATYAETCVPGNGSKIIGDGIVTINIAQLYGGTPGVALYNLRFIQGSITPAVTPNCYDCIFLAANPIDTGGTSNTGSSFKGCTFYNTSIKFTYDDQYLTFVNGENLVSNNTFHNCNTMFTGMVTNKKIFTYNIFNDCNLNFTSSPSFFDYNLCNSGCNYRFGTLSASTTYSPSVPAGYSNYSTIATLRAANIAAFGSVIIIVAVENFNNCKIANPLFNNAAGNDYTISANSPARFRSKTGYYWGSGSVNFAAGFSDAKKVISIVTKYGSVNDPYTPARPPFIDLCGDSISLPNYLGVITGYTALLPGRTGITCNAIAEGGNTVYSPHGTEGNPSGNFQFYRLEALNKGYSGQYVTICYGVNDWFDTIVNDTWEATYKGYIQAFLTAGFAADHIILQVPPFQVQYWISTIDVRFRIKRIAMQLGIILFDVFQACADTGNNDAQFFNSLHPNSGFHANVWAPKLDSLIKR